MSGAECRTKRSGSNRRRYSNIEKRIYEIGVKLTRCEKNCDGVVRDRKKGIIPRTLIFEADGRRQGTGCAIVGINPGRSGEREQRCCRESSGTYDGMVRYWNEVLRSWKYYKRLRGLADGLGVKGPILWTNLVKCENSAKEGLPPQQTLRVCAREYLVEELKSLPGNWPFIAAGREAYKALAYLFPERSVAGVPHPTGSHGRFQALFHENEEWVRRPNSRLRERLREFRGEKNTAVWLDRRGAK
jgi:hypothetical protein